MANRKAASTRQDSALLAKMAVTLDEVSKGRAILGIGAGWHAREHEAYGWDFPSLRERSDRLEEACEVLDLHCEAVGRDPAEISRTVHIPLRIMDDEQNAKELRADDDWKPIGSVQRVIDKCGDFIAAGVEEFCFAGIPQHPAVYQRLNEEVLPAFSRGLL